MFDKLEMRSQEVLDLRAIEKIFSENQMERMSDSTYKSSLYILTPERRVVLCIIHTDPIWSNAAPTKITTNPTHWPSFEAFKAFLSKICNPDTLEITRIDHAVDFEIPIETLHQCIRIKHKARGSTYKENCSFKGPFITGFYLGVEPELYCIYDKGYHFTSRRKKKLTRNKDFDCGILSRIELRQFKNKVKYKRLNELEKYLTDSPFKNIEYHESNGASEKAKALQILINEDGLQRAIAQLNRHKNFKRNHSNNLIQIDFESSIRVAYEENLRRFFKVIQ